MNVELEISIHQINTDFLIEYSPDTGIDYIRAKDHQSGETAQLDIDGLFVIESTGALTAKFITLEQALNKACEVAYEEYKQEEVMSHHEETYYEDRKNG